MKRIANVMIAVCMLALANSSALAEEKTDQSLQSQEKISADAAKEHELAADQLEEAAGHHRKVAQYYKTGRLEDAGWNAYMAGAHVIRAEEHIRQAAMLHLSEKRNISDKVTPTEPKP